MAWNPSPEVAVARDAAAKLKAKQCVVIYITEDDKVGMASFGKTKVLCSDAGKLGDFLFHKAMERLAGPPIYVAYGDEVEQ